VLFQDPLDLGGGAQLVLLDVAFQIGLDHFGRAVGLDRRRCERRLAGLDCQTCSTSADAFSGSSTKALGAKAPGATTLAMKSVLVEPATTVTLELSECYFPVFEHIHNVNDPRAPAQPQCTNRAAPLIPA
jgi:hypothetical protein